MRRLRAPPLDLACEIPKCLGNRCANPAIITAQIKPKNGDYLFVLPGQPDFFGLDQFHILISFLGTLTVPIQYTPYWSRPNTAVHYEAAALVPVQVHALQLQFKLSEVGAAARALRLRTRAASAP